MHLKNFCRWPRFGQPPFCLSRIRTRPWTPYFAAAETPRAFTEARSTYCAVNIPCCEAWRNLNGWNQSASHKKVSHTPIFFFFFFEGGRKTTRASLFTYTPVSISSLNCSTFQCTKGWATEQLRGRSDGEINRIFENTQHRSPPERGSDSYGDISPSFLPKKNRS